MTAGRRHTAPCPTCAGSDPVALPAACPACGGRGVVDQGPQPVASALQELLRRAAAAAPVGAIPAPPAGAPTPPRPFSEVDDEEPDAP